MIPKLPKVIGKGLPVALCLLCLLLFSSLPGLAQPKVVASLANNNGCRYQTVAFAIQNPPAGMTGAVWSFGDGGTAPSIGVNTQHYYSMAGTYVITVTISAPGGPYFAKSDSVYINNLPRPGFVTTNGTTFCNPATVCFQDNSQPAIPLPGRPIAPITKEIFLFGNGYADFNLHVPPASRNFCYTYPSPNYDVYTQTLRITDVLGCTDTIRKAHYIYVAGVPGARFSVNAPAGCNKIPMQFTTTATFTNLTRSEVVFPDSVKWFRWEFGDGTFDTNPAHWSSVQHTYTANGVFSPRLIVEAFPGCRDTFTLFNGVRNVKFDFDVSHNVTKGYTNNVCWNQTPVPNSTKTWKFYSISNPPFNPSNGTYQYGNWAPISPDPSIFTENQSFTPCRSIPCGITRASLQIMVQGCKDTTWTWDTVEVMGPDAKIEIAGSNSTAIADSMRYQCKVINPVHFPNNSCHYRAFHVQRLWNFGDKYARQCTTDTKNNLNVSGHDTLSLLDPITYPPGNNRPCNCNFSRDSLPSHTYTDWDTLALRMVAGKTFLSVTQPPYNDKNFPCYTVKLMLYDSVNKFGDTDQVQLPFGPPKTGPNGTAITVSGHTRVVMPNTGYSDAVLLKKNSLNNCMGASPNGISFDLSGLQPSCSRSWISINYDSAQGIQPGKWVTQPSHFSKLNNQNPWVVPASPKEWPNVLTHNYFDPPGIVDTNGYVTIGIVAGNGYGNKMCYDTTYYHKFIRFTPFSPVWDLAGKPYDCFPMVVRGSIRDNYQDSIAAIIWNWQDGWLDIDSIMRPFSAPNVSTYKRYHYVINPQGQVVSTTDHSSIPDTVIGIDTLSHKYNTVGRFFPNVTLVNTQGCSQFYLREVVNGFQSAFTATDTVVCPGDTITFDDKVCYWLFPQPVFPPTEVCDVGRDPYLGGWRSVPPTAPYQTEQLNWRILKRDSTNGQLAQIDQMNGPLPDYKFNDVGLYSVQLIITDSAGCRDTTSNWITVAGLKAGIHIPKPVFGCADTVKLFDNSRVTDPYFQVFGIKSDSIKPVNQNGYYWDFGDSKTPSPLMNPVHEYVPGTYQVYHLVRSVNGCEAQTIDTVRVDGPRAYFDIMQSSGMAPFTATFDNKSNDVVNNSQSFIWYFGDPMDPFNMFATNSDSNVSKTYTKPGTYCVYLVAQDRPLAVPNVCPVVTFPDSLNGTIQRCVTVLPNPAGISKVKHANQIFVYPNPAKDKLTIYSEQELKTPQVSVIDMVGRVHVLPLKKVTKTECALDLISLSPGAYVVIIKQQAGISHLRFIKE